MFEKIRKKKPKGRLFRRFSAVGAALSLILSFDAFSATVEPGEEGPEMTRRDIAFQLKH